MIKFNMTIAGEKLEWTEKSHAQIFRNFWNHYMEQDVEKMKEIIELTNIRTSELEFFVAKNGSKKKNIFVSENYYIYTHLAPIAMQRVYDKFKAGLEGTYNKPEPKPAKTPKADAETTETEVTTDNTENVVETPPVTEDVKHTCLTPEEFELNGKNEISLEEYGSYYDDLKQTQKMTVSKKFKKKLRENA